MKGTYKTMELGLWIEKIKLHTSKLITSLPTISSSSGNPIDRDREQIEVYFPDYMKIHVVVVVVCCFCVVVVFIILCQTKIC